MKSSLRVASPPGKPLVLYDGDCNFCSLWVRRWEEATAGRVDYQPAQDARVAARFPELGAERLASAVHLVEPDGAVTSGAEAAFRILAHRERGTRLLDCYLRFPAFARASEWCYGLVAGHRHFFSALTRLGWGQDLSAASHRLVQAVFVRYLGAVYLIAFVSLWVQILGLIGSDGILPAQLTLESVRQQALAAHVGWERFHYLPTLCWFSASDGCLQAQCAAGVVLALLVLVGVAPAPSLFGLWVLYLSLTAVGREFLSFQWDALLLETGFLAIFFAPVTRLRPSSRAREPSRLMLWLLRWLLFRLMFASGCVKLLSGDTAWRDLTALTYHYETQPLPTWLGWYAYQLPAWFQTASTALMFGVELVLPFLIFAPRRLRKVPCVAFITLQLLIGLTGNYCFFNLLTIGLCLLLLDDAGLNRLLKALRLRRLAGPGLSPEVEHAAAPGVAGDGEPMRRAIAWRWPGPVAWPVTVLVLLVSLVQFSGLFGWGRLWPAPVTRFCDWVAPFRSFNSYGLFAVMTTSRPEIVVQGSEDGVTWRDYEFKYKPGALTGRPAFVEPHQPRLDWQMWFAALGDYRQNPWFVEFCIRLLQGSPAVLELLKENPFPARPPRYVRAMVYDYRFTTLAAHRQTGAWWQREEKGEYLPMISLRKQEQ